VRRWRCRRSPRPRRADRVGLRAHAGDEFPEWACSLRAGRHTVSLVLDVADVDATTALAWSRARPSSASRPTCLRLPCCRRRRSLRHRWLIESPLATVDGAPTRPRRAARPVPAPRGGDDEHEVYTEPGDIVYVTWMVKDEQRTAAFFGELLGWTFTPGSVDHASGWTDPTCWRLWAGRRGRNDAKLMYTCRHRRRRGQGAGARGTAPSRADALRLVGRLHDDQAWSSGSTRRPTPDGVSRHGVRRSGRLRDAHTDDLLARPRSPSHPAPRPRHRPPRRELMASATPDGFDDHNSFRGSGADFATGCARSCPTRSHDALHRPAHIRLDGDVAQVDTYCVAHHVAGRRRRPGDGHGAGLATSTASSGGERLADRQEGLRVRLELHDPVRLDVASSSPRTSPSACAAARTSPTRV